MTRGAVGGGQQADYGYSRCTGTDDHKFRGQALCRNRSVRSDKLKAAVWHQIETLLDDPQRFAEGRERRIAAAREGKARQVGRKLDGLNRQNGQLRRGIDRLIDNYVEEIIEADEPKPHLAGLKQRLARLQADVTPPRLRTRLSVTF